MKKLLVLAVALGGFTVACGDDETTPPPVTPAAKKITVSGTVSLHPFSAGVLATSGTAFDMTALAIQIVDPADVIANPTGFVALATTAPTDCAMGTTGPACTFSAADVVIDDLSLGLVALVADTRTGTAKQFETANVGIFGGSTVVSLKANPTDFTGAPLFAVSTESAQAAAAYTGVAYSDMVARGYLFGLLLDANRAPLNGYAIEAANTSLTVSYLAPATSTANGLFFAVAGAGTTAAVISSWEACPTAQAPCDSADADIATLAAAGTNPGTVFVLAWITD